MSLSKHVYCSMRSIFFSGSLREDILYFPSVWDEVVKKIPENNEPTIYFKKYSS